MCKIRADYGKGIKQNPEQNWFPSAIIIGLSSFMTLTKIPPWSFFTQNIVLKLKNLIIMVRVIV